MRTERDSMGEMEVSDDALWGAQTQRAVLNFPISDLRFPRRFIEALAQIKEAAALANAELGLLDPGQANAIAAAAREAATGKLDGHFVVDIFQTGSGTSTNMNVNEVLSNRAIQMLGGVVGSRSPVHPNDHVNLGQSSNDVIPTAIHIAAATAIQEELIPVLGKLQAALEEKAQAFMPIIKTGRTHLQDATPIRLGQEFQGYASQAQKCIHHLRGALDQLCEVALGGTAVGTGVNTHPEFAARVCQRLAQAAGLPIRETEHHFQAQSTLDTVVQASGTLNTVAASMMKVANDLRWLGSGPRAGIGEITLPEVQPGSSIMPGKVNPVIAESVCQVCAQVMGNHVTITVAGQSGNFEINVMMPVAAYNLLQSITLLARALDNFVDQCVAAIAVTGRGPQMVEQGLAIATGLVPRIGYDAAAEVAKEAARTGQTVRQVARQKTALSEEELDRLLDPAQMAEPGLTGAPGSG